jgi:hypothetical protein
MAEDARQRIAEQAVFAADQGRVHMLNLRKLSLPDGNRGLRRDRLADGTDRFKAFPDTVPFLQRQEPFRQGKKVGVRSEKMIPDQRDEQMPLIQESPPVAHLDGTSELLQSFSMLPTLDAPAGQGLAMTGKVPRHRGKQGLLFPAAMQEQVFLERAHEFLQTDHRVPREGLLELSQLLQKRAVLEREDLGHSSLAHGLATLPAKKDRADGPGFFSRFDLSHNGEKVAENIAPS